MIRTIMLSLLILIAATSAVYAAEQPAPENFSERKVNLAEIGGIRVGYGKDMVRIVLDIAKEVEYTESYAEFPSRMILDFKNTWLSPTVQRELALKSIVATKIRIAQFNPTTVRIVIETQAETKLFYLDGGPKGKRFIIDLGKQSSKPTPEVKTSEPQKPDDSAAKEQKARELQEQKERELQEQKERELKEQKERELQEQKERELQEQKERELQEQKERELKEQKERELKEQKERELKEQHERELKEQKERELKEQKERELKEQKERELKEQKERELKEQKERELKEQKEREKKEKREREKREKERKEREKKEKDKKSKDADKPVPATEVDKDINEITALTDRKIVIDPGHGGNDAGAIGPTGVMEKSVTLRVALELNRLLQAEGADVVLTRYDDRTVSEKGAKASDIEELGARCDVANRFGAEIFISIHADSFTRPEARGTTGYYYSKSETDRGRRLADCIRRNLVEQLGTPSRGTQPCNFYVVKNTDMPATLIELGFISNKDEEKLLNSEDGVKRAAQAILDGIEDYFG